jgi:hypothetical protein
MREAEAEVEAVGMAEAGEREVQMRPKRPTTLEE